MKKNIGGGQMIQKIKEYVKIKKEKYEQSIKAKEKTLEMLHEDDEDRSLIHDKIDELYDRLFEVQELENYIEMLEQLDLEGNDNF